MARAMSDAKLGMLDYRVGGTRVVRNPRDYLPREPNPAFDPALVVEVGN